MSRTITIHFPPEQAERSNLVHRLQNFGEDVFRHLRDTQWGVIDLKEVDRATERFSITDVKASKLRRLISWIEREAERQHLQIKLDII